MRRCHTRSCAFRALVGSSIIALGMSLAGGVQAQEDGPPITITLAEKNNLASLIDLCAERLDLNIEYHSDELRRLEVTLRLGAGVTDDELWTLTNRLLAAHGWTSVQMPGDTVLSIVKLSDAQKQSRFEDAKQLEGRAGFTVAVRRIDALSVNEAVGVVKPLLSQPGGQAIELGQTDLILISDLKPRLRAILDLLDRLDRREPGDEVRIERIEPAHVDATQLVAQVSAAVQARDAIEPRPLPGKVSASVDGRSVILVAPPSTLSTWHDLITRFDQRETVMMRTYSPRHFGISEVASLIEQSVSDQQGGSAERWRLVQDELTRTLIITATAGEHEAIQALFDRLGAIPPAARRPLRAFTIRNRNVSELMDVLDRLIEEEILGTDIVMGSDLLGQDARNRDATQGGGAGETNNAEGVQTDSLPGTITSTALSLTADETTNSLIAIGEPRMLTQLEALLRILDVRQPQVELEVFVVSLTEGDTLDLGIELQKLEMSGSTLIGLSSLFGLTDLTLDSDSPLTGGRGFSGVVLSPGDFSVVVRALKTINRGSSRSYPRMLINNNEQATLDAVLQEPFSSINASDTVATTSFGDFVDAGTQVTVTPQIAEGDHLVLEYNVTLSAFVGESSDPNLPPPRQQTSLQSVVTIPDGYAIAVGGLEVVNEAEAVSQIPLLGDLPFIGELFKNRSRSQSRSRFYVFIRANVLRHDGFEDLKYLSDREAVAADFDDGWPILEPRVIK